MPMLSSIYEKEADGVVALLDAARRSRIKTERVDLDSYMQKRHVDETLIRSPTDFRDELHRAFAGEDDDVGLELPWTTVASKFRIRPGEVTVWAGFNGHMKSMVTSYVSLALMNQGAKVCIASFEMKPKATLKRLGAQAIGTANPTPKYTDMFLDSLVGKLWLYDQQGDASADRVLALVYHCAEQMGVNQIVIDSMMKVVVGEDDYNGQKRFMAQLCSAARDLGIHIHLIHHSRKLQDENRPPGKQDAKGSGAIVDQTDNFVTVFKMPEPPAGKPKTYDMLLKIEKQRHGEWEGSAKLWFLSGSLQFHDTPHPRPTMWLSNATEGETNASDTSIF